MADETERMANCEHNTVPGSCWICDGFRKMTDETERAPDIRKHYAEMVFGKPRARIFADIAAECERLGAKSQFVPLALSVDVPNGASARRALYLKLAASLVSEIESLDRKAGGAT